MTNKATGKEQAPPVRTDAVAPEDLRTAYQVHTLAQVLYGHLATSHPWFSTAPGSWGYDPLGTPYAAPTPVTPAWPGAWSRPGWRREDWPRWRS